MKYIIAIFYHVTIAWLVYFYFISPIFKKPERMELVDIIDEGGGGGSFFFVGNSFTFFLGFICFAMAMPVVCIVQFLTGHTMGIGAEREFIFRKENGEVVSLRMRNNDLKFLGSKNFVIGDVCNVKYIKHMLQRVRVDKTVRMAAYNQVYGNKREELPNQQKEQIGNWGETKEN